jgi:hypothetical protein
MKLNFLNRFFPKLFIGVWLNGDKYYINVQKVTPAGSWKSDSYTYIKEEEQQLFKQLEKLQSETVFSYIAFLDNSHFQGAIPTARESEFLNYREINRYEDFDDIFFKKFNDSWSVYTLKSEMILFQSRYKSVGYDYVFSPFFLPISLQKRNQLIQKTSLFAIVEEETTIIAIFNNDRLLYGRYVDEVDFNEIDIEETKTEIEDDVFEISSDSKLDPDIESVSGRKTQSDSNFFEDEIELDLYDLELDDELPEIETKDEEAERKIIENEFSSVDVLDNDFFSEANEKNDKKVETFDDMQVEIDDLEKEIEIELDEDEELIAEVENEGEIDYNFVYQAVRIGVNEFYNQELFQSDFIENTYIVTNQKVSNTFLQKLEKDYSFGAEKIRVDFSELIVEMVKEEVYSEI